MMASSDTQRETSNISSRYTKDGRKISYHLVVKQQPERARACGQGAKSSSDRRPVDPPPIVQLRIYQGDQDEDITFPYNAGFFLFATLEPAQPIAHSRVPQSQTNQPVLTGTPVAGIAYLERPHPAGYFIFPDLSVRHEGEYTLTFTLFEELKEPRDADADASDDNVVTHVHRRCEVSSIPFHVFSAKKFPGLCESTLLSRTVADQGCRVRIRRDVRVRRPGHKEEKEGWPKTDDEPSSEGAQMGVGAPSYGTKTITSPQQPSESLEKSDSAPSSTQTLQAQPPNQGVAQQSPTGYPYQWYPPPNTGQPTAQHIYTQQAPPDQAYAPQYQSQYSPTHPQGMAQFSQYSPTYGYPPGGPSPQIVQSPTYAYVPQQSIPSMYAQQQQDMSQIPQARAAYQQHHQQHHQQPQSQAQHHLYSNMYTSDRDQSSLQYSQSAAAAYASQHAQQQQQQQQQQQPPTLDTSTNPTSQQPNVPLVLGKPLPPMEVPRVSHGPAESLSSAATTTITTTAPATTAVSAYQRAQGPPTTVTTNGATAHRPVPPQYLSSNGGAGTKRTFSSSFNTTDEPLRNGARPNAEARAPDWSDNSEEDVQDLESIRMTYRRADGTYTVVSPRRF